MKKYELSDAEIKKIKGLRKAGIPMIFKSKYLDYLLTIETIHMFVTDDLLKGKAINYNCEDFEDFINIVDESFLDYDSLTYLKNLKEVYNLYKKYKI